MDNPMIEQDQDVVANLRQPELPEAPAPIEIKISLPDVITVGVWLEYMQGRDRYSEARSKLKLPTFEILADYAGVLGLIAAGLVHVRVEGGDLPAEIQHYLDLKDATSVDINKLDMAFVGAMVLKVARPVERAVYGPLGQGRVVIS